MKSIHKEFLEDIGTEIRTERARRKMSLQKLSEICGLKIPALSRIENGQVNTHILSYKRIADALDISVNDLLIVSLSHDNVKKYPPTNEREFPKDGYGFSFKKA